MKPESLRDVLRRLRGDITQAQLAEMLELSPGAIGLIETGKRSMSVAVVDRIAAALNLSEQDHSDLRMARERTSAELASTRHSAVPLDMIDGLMVEMRRLADEVARLQDRLDRLEP